MSFTKILSATLLTGLTVILSVTSVSAQSTTPPQEADAPPSTATTAEIQNSLCAGANLDVTTTCNTGLSAEEATQAINDLIGDVINLFSVIVGVVAVIMIIIGGFKYITSAGDSTNVSSAKNTILYAIIGLIIVALSQTIVRFVLGRVIAA